MISSKCAFSYVLTHILSITETKKGDQSSGKTCIIQRAMNDTFQKEYEETLGVDLFTKTIATEKKKVRLQVWDTSGQERFKTSIPSYIRDCHVAIVPFDCTSRTQYDSMEKWIDEVSKIREKDEVWIYLVATKCDKPIETRVFTPIEMEKKIQKLQRKELQNNNIIQYIETSSKAGYNIRKLMHSMASALIDQTASSSTPQDVN